MTETEWPLLAIVDSSDECDVETGLLGALAEVRAYATRDEAALPEEIGRATGLMVRSGIRLTARTVARLTSCRVIVRAGVGFDNVDGAAAGRAGIPLLNVPD